MRNAYLYDYSMDCHAKNRAVDQKAADTDGTSCSVQLVCNLNGSRMHHCINFVTED